MPSVSALFGPLAQLIATPTTAETSGSRMRVCKNLLYLMSVHVDLPAWANLSSL